jgi:hypothetical protein
MSGIEPVTQDCLNKLKAETTALAIHTFAPSPYDDIFVAGCPFTHTARNSAVERALEFDWTHALFVDHDMKFPPDALLRLLSWGKEIIGGQYIMRNPPFFINLWKEPVCQGTQLRRPEWREGLHRVGAIGMGLTLITRQVFVTMGKDWFSFKEFDGEDMEFCVKAERAGFPTYVDCDIPVQHIGKYEYPIDHMDRCGTSAERWLEDKLRQIGDTDPVTLSGEVSVETG